MGSVLHGSNYKNKKYHNRPLQWKEIHPCLLHLLHYAVVSPCVVKKNQSVLFIFYIANWLFGVSVSVTSSRSKRANNNAEHNPKGNQKPQGFIKTSQVYCVSLVMRLAFIGKERKKKRWVLFVSLVKLQATVYNQSFSSVINEPVLLLNITCNAMVCYIYIWSLLIIIILDNVELCCLYLSAVSCDVHLQMSLSDSYRQIHTPAIKLKQLQVLSN